MELLMLRPDQIVAMIDYPPLHSPEALERYYRRFCAGARDISPVPVANKDLVLAYFRHREERYASYSRVLRAFLAEHPTTDFFELGGYHRSAAAVLSGRLIPCVSIAADDDFREINASADDIQLHGDYTTVVGDMESIDEELQDLEQHFHQHRRFWTVEEKVRLMVSNGDVPEHMLAPPARHSLGDTQDDGFRE